MTALKRMRILSLALTLTMLFTAVMAFPSSVSAADWDYSEGFTYRYSYGTFAGSSSVKKVGSDITGTATTTFSVIATLSVKADMAYYRRNTVTGALEQGGKTTSANNVTGKSVTVDAKDTHPFACNKMWSKGTHSYILGSNHGTYWTYQEKII